jgi:hypothetical protein
MPRQLGASLSALPRRGPPPLLLAAALHLSCRRAYIASATATSHFKFPEQEQAVLEHWRQIDAFKTSLKQSAGKKPFTFFDG